MKKRNPSKPYAHLSASERAKVVGRLGGIARSKKLSPEERSKISAKGGLVTYLRHGSEFFRKLGTEQWNSMTPEEQDKVKARLNETNKKRLLKQIRKATMQKINQGRKKGHKT